MGILRHSLLLLFITSVSCCGLGMQYGNITQDLNLEVNNTLTIRCSLFGSSIIYENKTYDVSSERLRLKFKTNYLDVKIINDLTVEYSVENAQENDTGSYSCYVSPPKINKNILVCVTYIAVGYKPLPVQNFSCISHAYYSLICSWIEPPNPIDTIYTLYDLVANTAERACPEKINDTSCQWTIDSSPLYIRGLNKLNFFLIGKNPLGEIKQYMSVEDHWKIVIPGIPEDVIITNVTTTSLVVRWSPPRYMNYNSFPPGLHYSILYEPISYEGNQKEILITSKLERQVTVENLIPHTEYLIKVRCRSSVVDNDDMWSPVASATAGTESDVPYLAPEINPSSFEIEETGNRTITLYWKGIPAEYENGVDFRYVIQYHIHHVSSRTVRHTEGIQIGNRTLYSFQHLDTHSAYLFKLYAVNKMGPSRNSSEIIIDKSEKLLEKPKDIVVISFGQGKYNLSWKASNQRPYNFTVFWCKSLNPRPYKCDGSLEWMHTIKTNHVLELPDKKTNYQFAVSANDEGFTSGMSWASCIVYYKGVNYKVKKVEMTLKTATSLKIQWSLECEAQKIVMKEYAIEYCEFEGPCSQTLNTKSCTDWKTVNVSNVSKEDYILGSLKPFTHYLAFIRVRTLSGWSSNSNVACKRTMPAAPSDSPRNVTVVKVDGKSVTVSFKPPLIPNGIITRYIAYYNKSDGTSHHHEYRLNEIVHRNSTSIIFLSDFIMSYYTNYSIQLVACVDQACSEKSHPAYAFTDISNPGIISYPKIEVIDNLVNVSWDDPTSSNGPLNYYQVLRESNNSLQIFNVTGRNYLLLNHNCSENDDGKVIYNFRVRAVNINKNGFHLVGRDSSPTKTMLCPIETPIGVIVGIVVGSTAGIIIVTLLLYSLISWMKNEVDMIKGIQIQLPKDLDSPMENPLSSYDKFKNGLQTNHDSGIPCDTSYERLCAFASDEVKDIGRTMEENSQKSKRKSSGRNNSGESTASGKCHDSISSSNTTKTHLSIDSGAEVDSPPSPDGLFSDTSSSHTTPRSYKPDLTIVREANGTTSKDSGLDREGTCTFINHSVDLPSKFTYFVKKKNFPYSSMQMSNGEARMPSYSKFTVIGTGNIPSFIPYSEQNLGLLDSLSNSEPSVADFDIGSGSEPLVPYCKFGLARSAGNGLNMSNQPVIVNNKIGYSKFGTVYRALKRRESGSMNNSLNTCPKFLPHNPQTFTALTSNSTPFGKHLSVKENEKAYSKFGVSDPKKVPVNGYVSFRDTLTYPSAETSGANQAYSKLGMTTSNEKTAAENTDHAKENGVIINAAELQSLPLSSQTKYVPFRNAKVMNLNDPVNKEGTINKEDFLNKDESLCKEDLTEQNSVPNYKPQTDKDSVVDNDIDIIIATDPPPSLIDEITDVDSKLKPTNFTISANNDSKGFLIQDESCAGNSVTPLNNIIDDIFGTLDFGMSKNTDITPICINLDHINIANPSTYPAVDSDISSVNDLSAESRNFCNQCDNFATECTCSNVAKNPQQIDLICNGHSEPLHSDYVSLG